MRFTLPDRSTWRFDEIAASERDRAEALEAAGEPEALIASLRAALQNALDCVGSVRLGCEHAAANYSHVRAVVQFPVGKHLFDWFLNARTGYRAHFRAHYKCGLRFNNLIVQALLPVLITGLPKVTIRRELDHRFNDVGDASISEALLTRSLAPYVTKVWMCTKRIGRDGGNECLSPGLTGPKVLLNHGESWLAPYREGAWLDIKGGFLGERLFQPKHPIKRAKKLIETGEA